MYHITLTMHLSDKQGTVTVGQRLTEDDIKHLTPSELLDAIQAIASNLYQRGIRELDNLPANPS